jgi:hypothetical protein
VFVRVKSVKGRRYAYLINGVREGKRVRQETLYLGSLPELSFSGVPDDVMERAAGRFQFDRKTVNDQIRQIPLSFDELSEARREQFAVSIRSRHEGTRTQGGLPRARGELSALSRLAEVRFRDMFLETGELTYRMRMK